MVKEKAKYRKKTIYFKQDNTEVFDYLNSRNDVSEYICDLIKADLGMNKEEVDMSLLLSKLDKIEKKLNNINVVSVSGSEVSVSETENKVEEMETESEPAFDPCDILL